MTFNKFMLLASAATFLGASACPLVENYQSAGIVPLFETGATRGYSNALTFKKGCLLCVKKSHDGTSLLTDKSKKRIAQDADSAETAARAFFKHQNKYACVYELAQALRTSATKVYMGDHITYFLEFSSNELSDLMMAEGVYCYLLPRNNHMVITYCEDLKESMNFGWKKRSNNGSAKDVLVRDAFGHLRTIMDKFLIGLTDNYSKIKYLFA